MKNPSNLVSLPAVLAGSRSPEMHGIVAIVKIIGMEKLQVLQFEGLAPSVLCGVFFADMGAEVTIVARHEPQSFSIPINENLMNRNKKCICLNLKKPNDIEIIKYLLMTTDIVIDPFRPGVLEKMGLGPADMEKINPRTILLRVSGFGQEGEHAHRPGHDLNYIGMAGILSKFGQQEKPQFPNNYAADFAGCMFGITGTMAALLERRKTGLGQVVDCSLMHCSRYMGLPLSNYVDTAIVGKYQDAQGKEYIGSFSSQAEKQSFEATLKQHKDYEPLAENSLTFTKVMRLEDLPTAKHPINYMQEGLIMPASNPMQFEITSPFTQKRASVAAPHRGEHTQSLLKQKGVPSHLIAATIKSPTSKL